MDMKYATTTLLWQRVNVEEAHQPKLQVNATRVLHHQIHSLSTTNPVFEKCREPGVPRGFAEHVAIGEALV